MKIIGLILFGIFLLVIYSIMRISGECSRQEEKEDMELLAKDKGDIK